MERTGKSPDCIKLRKKVAVVTASTKGIGLACAEILAAHGARVYLAARARELAEQAALSITRRGGEAFYVHFNAREPDSYAAMIGQVAQREGRLDILVNNYGGTDVRYDKDLVQGDSDDFFVTLRENVQSVYLPSKAAVPLMIQNGGGSIVNISSIGSVVPDLTRLAYSVSKAAVNALTQNIAMQYAQYHIRCNAVLPGLTVTKAATENMPPAFREAFLRHVPLGRPAQPEDIARAVLYFASDDAAYVTGALHEVAGGFGMGTPLYADFIHAQGPVGEG